MLTEIAEDGFLRALTLRGSYLLYLKASADDRYGLLTTPATHGIGAELRTAILGTHGTPAR
jgi:hypothetical protein